MDKLTVKFNFRPRKANLLGTRDESEKQPKDKTAAERQRRCRANKAKNPEAVEAARKINVAQCTKYRNKIKQQREASAIFDEAMKKKERERKAAYRKKVKERKQKEQGTTDENNNKMTKLQRKVKTLQQSKRRIVKRAEQLQAENKSTPVVSPDAKRKRAERVRKSLPQSPTKWASTIDHVIRNASPRKKKELSTIQKKGKSNKRIQRDQKKQQWKEKVHVFLNRDDMSRKMPNKKDVIHEDGNSIAKRHLLFTKKEAYMKFLKEFPSYPYRYTTFRNNIPRHVKKMNLKDRRVCVCLKCFNMEEKLRPINRFTSLCKLDPLSLRGFYEKSVCEFETFPNPNCIERNCEKCRDLLSTRYEAMVKEHGSTSLNYVQWEQKEQTYRNPKGELQKKKVWQQIEHCDTLQKVFTGICNEQQDFIGHMFRNDYQYMQHQALAKSLPEDHAIVYADFSQNYTLEANDEIQTAHYVKRQVTLHTMYLLRHAKSSTVQNPQLTREAVAIISDDLKHSSSSVYTFTMKLLSYMRDNPEKVALPTVLHRITDNCAFEYKCKQAFAHMLDYQKTMSVKVVYHYSEPGHGKGPHDGLGATIKHGLDMLVVRDRVRLRNAYEVYLAATRHLSIVGQNAEPSKRKQYEFSKRTILFVPATKTRNAPLETVKMIPGTMKLRSIQNISDTCVETANLSCSCNHCLIGTDEPCAYSNWRKTTVVSLRQESPNLHEDVHVADATTNLNDRQADSGQTDPDLDYAIQINRECNEVHMQQNAITMTNFACQMANKGWRIRGATPYDGNCCFCAISDQLQLKHFECVSHENLRQNVVNYIDNLPEDVKAEMAQFMTVPLNMYLRDMEKNGTYADHIVLKALSEMLEEKIRVIHADSEDVVLNPNDSTTSQLVLGYLPQIQHYVSLEPRYKPDDFVAVYLSSKKKKHFYVAKVIEVEDSEVHLRFLTQKRDNLFVWPDKEDISWQAKEDVGCTLTLPVLMGGRGIQLRFNAKEIKECISLSTKK